MGDDRYFFEIAILVRPPHPGLRVADPGLEERNGFGCMDPGKQLRIVGAVSPAVRQRSADLPVNVPHLGDRRLGFVAPAIGRQRNEPRSPAQSPVHVFPEAGMVPYPGEHRRVEHLQQQRADPADHHRGHVAVDAPGNRRRAEQPIRPALDRPFSARGIVEDRANPTGDRMLDYPPHYREMWRDRQNSTSRSERTAAAHRIDRGAWSGQRRGYR